MGAGRAGLVDLSTAAGDEAQVSVPLRNGVLEMIWRFGASAEIWPVRLEQADWTLVDAVEAVRCQLTWRRTLNKQVGRSWALASVGVTYLCLR
jgi:hypothetical protein